MKVEGNIEKYYHYAFPMQTILVTCNDDKGKTNIITLAWHTPISRKPPLYGISISPKRYSYALIKKARNLPSILSHIPWLMQHSSAERILADQPINSIKPDLPLRLQRNYRPP
jgi:hypothetical protein